MSVPVLPHRKVSVKEGSACFLDLTHLDKTDTLAAPTTLQYRIDDITNNREVLDWTTVSTPSTTNEITITDTQNALYSRSTDRELRQITVKTTDASGNDNLEPFYYEIVKIFQRDAQLT